MEMIFIQLGDEDAVADLHRVLGSIYTVKLLSVIGAGSLEQEAVILNRIVLYIPEREGRASRMELEADQRHVEVLLADLGLNTDRAKGVDTPRVKRSEAEAFTGLERPSLITRELARIYRSGTMRLSYLSQDRADVQEAAKCLAQRMKEPNEYDMQELRRAGRYLLKHPRAVLCFEEQDAPKELHGWVDSDYAGVVATRRPTSGVVQEPIGLSSGESEFYAAVKGGAVLLGLKSLMQDWGLSVLPVLVLNTDSSAAKGFASRRGLVRNRFVSTRFPWLRDAVSSDQLRIRKVRTTYQLGDFLTKQMPQSWYREKLAIIGL